MKSRNVGDKNSENNGYSYRCYDDIDGDGGGDYKMIVVVAMTMISI